MCEHGVEQTTPTQVTREDFTSGDQEVEDRLIELITEVFKRPTHQITRMTHFIDDLGLDSLDSVTLVIKVEEKFGITIHDDDAAKLCTVALLRDYVLISSTFP